MIATFVDNNGVVQQPTNGGGSSWEEILGRVLGGINGAANPGQVTVGGSTPQVYAPGAAATDYMPLILIALVVVAIVVLAKH